MITRRLIFALSLAAGICATPGPALAQPPQGDPVYNVYYFSDSTHQQQVGIYHGDCTWWDGAVMYAWLEGQTSAYSEPVVVAYCYEGNWQPL